MKSATSAAEHGRRQTVGGLPPVPPRRDSPGRRDSTPMRLPRVRIRRRKLERIIDPIVAVDLAAIVAIKGRLAIGAITRRSEEHTSELPSLMRSSYAVFWLKRRRPRMSITAKQTIYSNDT